MPRHLLTLAVFALLIGCQPNTPLINPAPSASNNPSTPPPSPAPSSLATPSPVSSPMAEPPAPTAVPNRPSPTPEAPAETALLTVMSLSLAPSKVELAREGAQTQLIVYAKDAAGQLIDASQLELEWRSEDEQSFKIDADGTATALKDSGSGIIHVRELRSGLTATAQITMSSRGSSGRGGGGTPQSNEPTLSSISPTGGIIGVNLPVTLTGTKLSGATAVQFGLNQELVFTIDSDTQITVTPPLNLIPGAVDVTVTTPEGTSGPVTYTYGFPPILTLAMPSAGPTAGGTTVTLMGAFLNGATAVDFGGTPGTNINVVSDAQLTVTAPAGTVGPVNVTVTTPVGTTPPLPIYTYVAAPTVTTLAPNAGPLAGGTTVTVTGSGFSTATAVSFGANPATSFTSLSPTQIVATAPPGAEGTVDITVTTAGGSSTAVDAYTYVAAPSIIGVTPNAGPLAGGTTVTVTGTGLNETTAVSFGANPATSFEVVTPTQIVATAPSGVAGSVDITVTTAGGSSTAVAEYTYVAAPSIVGVTPNAGPLAGGTIVTVTGTGLNETTAVSFGANPAASFVVVTPTQIIATAPSGVAGSVDITVTTAGGSSTAVAEYTYVVAPTISGVTPNSGALDGGTLVTVTGSGFSTATAVSFGANPATSFVVVTPTQIIATAPAGVAGIVNVTVTTPGGTSVTSSADQFTYVVGP